jgi:hypothetical protein
MWRLALVLSLFLTLALGTVAEAKCRVCVDTVTATKTDTGMTLRFTARGVSLPETGTAVVMQVDGNRSKCINVSLRSVGGSGEWTTYVGSLTHFYGNTTFTGRVDIAGDIFEFAVPLDGKLGTIQLVGAGTAALASAPAPAQPVVITATPATAAPAVAAAPQVAPAPAIPTPREHPAMWLGAIVILATLAGAVLDRRRAMARATTA